MLTDELAQFIRRIDGNNSLGAAALAEQIVAWFDSKIEAIERSSEQAAYAAAIKACNNERVDAESTGAKEDHAYNEAIQHCADAIRSLMEQPE